ncbi:MAG: S8 family serine peptidase [Betaproteobacteria bacterium]
MKVSARIPRLAALAALAIVSPLAARVIVSPDLTAGFTPRLIVKFKPTAAPAAVAARVAGLAADTGIALVHRRTMAIGAQVLTSSEIKSPGDADAIAARLQRHPEIEYATRSRPLRAERVPNDPLYASQFALLPGAATIDAQGAWDLTVGAASTVVAVLDTGSTYHADLAGRQLPGYDFVAAFALSNDGEVPDAAGSYRDADASDPGDWITASEIVGNFADEECTAKNSSWHGTSVTGVIAANADNGSYLSGIDWRARILPVRVLGKCYGDDADVADAVAWAAGLAVPGVPLNAMPAQVINMSLGDPGACPQFFQDSISAALAHGITRAIVASAGNSNTDGDHFPSACAGVISVASSTLAGGRASYSNYGPRIDIAAPGGNGGGSSANNILTLVNLGLTSPTTDGVTYRAGTSFAAPLVSGVVSLMLSVAPDLSAPAVRALLAASAKPFPAGSTCTTSTCGAGLLDAPGAVRRAQAAAGTPVPVQLFEFYNAALDHYFITWSAAEIAALDAGTTLKGWTRTGKRFAAMANGVAGTVGVCRIYIPPGKGDGHYFGRDASECNSTMAKNPAFVLEAPAFFFLYPPDAGTCAEGTVPVYRVFSNRADANHRYTVERAVRDQMVAHGWLAEGDGDDAVVMCAPG